jgi:hypothetical protein
MGGIVKKFTQTLKKIINTPLDFGKRAADYGKDKAKGVVRSPGRMMKPKIPEPKVTEMPDQEEIERQSRRRLASRGGSRSNNVLTSGL